MPDIDGWKWKSEPINGQIGHAISNFLIALFAKVTQTSLHVHSRQSSRPCWPSSDVKGVQRVTSDVLGCECYTTLPHHTTFATSNTLFIYYENYTYIHIKSKQYQSINQSVLLTKG